LFAAAGTPEAVLTRLHGEVNKLLAEIETKNKLKPRGSGRLQTTVPEFRSLDPARTTSKYGGAR